jgi:hypothetical protein
MIGPANAQRARITLAAGGQTAQSRMREAGPIILSSAVAPPVEALDHPAWCGVSPRGKRIRRVRRAHLPICFNYAIGAGRAIPSAAMKRAEFRGKVQFIK